MLCFHYVHRSFPSSNQIASDYNTSEDTVLGAYKRQVGAFDKKAYNYAKAVACLRLISIYEVYTLHCLFSRQILCNSLYVQRKLLAYISSSDMTLMTLREL